MFRCIALALLVLICSIAHANDPDEVVFAQKLKPLLTAHCGACHTGAAAQAAFSVGSLADLRKGGKRGPAIQPGKSSASPLVQFLRGELSPRMPIGGEPLPEATITAIATAIDSMKPAAASELSSHTKWIFTSPKMPPVPAVKNTAWVRNPIDAFVLAKLESEGMTPSAPASKRALLRRVYFDLVGLPPTPEEANAFLTDNTPGAYERLVERLLADKRYGERWARHWLDLVRFAESDGFAIDAERPTAWRYRDYVIRAFNTDKPYDVFIQEQLAGDEMERPRAGRGMPMDGNEGLIALGYLRMGPWETDANFDDQLRLDWLNEMAGTTSQVFLGLTVGCARCHDHKYDPIPQRDFYRLQAFFASTRIEERPAPFLDAEGRRELRGKLRQLEDELDQLQAKRRDLDQEYRGKHGDEFEAKLPEAEKMAYRDLLERIARTNGDMLRYRPVAYSVNEVTPPAVLDISPTHVLAGGELAAKGEVVEPGFLAAITGKPENAKIPFSGRYRSGRRRALAEWLASADNPLTGRVMANRIWQHHFGEGIVRTPSDFGLNGDRPSHPELLDWLASTFMEKKWSIKQMHRLMLLSNTYQQSTHHPEYKKYAESDSDNRLLWRMNWMRMDAEVLRDSMLFLSGRLNPSTGGPGMFFSVSEEVAKGFQMFKWYPSPEQDQLRRSIYAFQRRSLMMPMLEVFDGANMSESCARRSSTTVAPQALTLLNGSHTASESRYFAERVIELAGPDHARQIDKAFELTLVREPRAEERAKAMTLYAGRQPKEALARLATVLFNLNEFLYLE